jgi:hypothetical protein
MRKFALLLPVLIILAFQVWPLTQAQAEEVGRLTQVKGRVDILKGGHLPATPAKINDGVQPGDVIRTKSLSKAQVTFMDNSILTISPESRVAIEEYMYDSAKNKRNAVIKLFQGLAHMVVSKITKAEEPDFVVKTNTAIMGVRGTDFGIRLQPNGSTILTFEGLLQVGNIFPEVGQLSRRASKVAYSSPRSWNQKAPGWVMVHTMEGVFVGRGLPPTVVFKLTRKDHELFMHQMGVGLISRQGGEAGTASGYPGSFGGQQSRGNAALGSQGPPNVTQGNLGNIILSTPQALTQPQQVAAPTPQPQTASTPAPTPTRPPSPPPPLAK